MISFNHKVLFALGAFLLLAFVVLAANLAKPFLLTVPLAVLLIWFLISNPRVLLYILLFSIPWSTEYNFSPHLGTDLPDEPLMVLLAITSVGLIVYNRKKIFSKGPPHPLILLLLVQMGWLFITVVLSSYPIISAKYFLAKSWYLLAFVASPLLLWKNEKILKNSAIILLVSMLGVTALTLYRHAFFGFTFSSINNALVPFFRNHVNYSALLVFMLPLQVACWQLATTKAIRLLVLFSFLITLPALYFSFARGAWLAFIIGVVAYWLLQKKWLFKSFVFTIIIVIAVFSWLNFNNRYIQFAHDYQTTVFHKNFGDHLEATYQLKDLSTAERFHRWVAGIRMAEQSWQTGFGPATFNQHYKGFTVPAFKTWVSKNEEQSTIHNYFLLLLVEQGVIGLLLFASLVGGGIWYAEKIFHRTSNVFWKRCAGVVAAIIAMQCTLNFLSDLIETDKVGSVFYLCFAALMLADKQTRARA